MPENIVKFILTQATDETIAISSLAAVLLGMILVLYWFYNRRKFQKLTHQIPASVVKNYLDSIIQNSTALKSSLFRGGGLELKDGLPSVVPTSSLPQSGQADAALMEELNQKRAQVQSLESTLGDKEKLIKDLEEQIKALKAQLEQGGAGADNSEELSGLKTENADLKKQIEELKASAGSGGGGDDAAMADITKERDELKERLQEYEIIEDDLANLKKLQQENEQLKAALESAGGSAPAPAEEAKEAPAPAVEEAKEAPATEEAPKEEAAPAAEEAPKEEAAPAGEEVKEAPAAEEATAAPAEAQAEEKKDEEKKEDKVPEETGDGKSAEDLLSEFEKMLG